MKTIFLILVLSVHSISFAISKESFITLDETEKAQFIQSKATEVSSDIDIQLFVKQHSLMNTVLEVGEDVSNIWGDTILEGPYSLVGDIETRVETLYMFNGDIYAVGATVASQALNTDSCLFDEETETWGDDCITGSISESFVVDLQGNTIDFGYYAEFND